MAAKAWSLTVPADDRYNYQIPGDIRDVKQHIQVAASLYAEAQATPDQTIAIYAGTVYFGPTRVAYAGLDVVDLGTGGTYEVSALTADYYNKVLFTLTAAGALAKYEGTEAAAAGDVVEPVCPAGEYPICMVTVQDDGTGTAGTILSIEQSEITQAQRVAPISPVEAMGTTILSGCLPTNDTDANHDINISPGYCVMTDGSGHYKMFHLAANLCKQSDAAWAAGDDAGGLGDSVSLATGSIYEFFLIGKDDGTVDGGYDTDAAAANLPEPEIEGRACTMRPGDVGFEECEACQ